MASISGRINGQSDYKPASRPNSAWREEMLGQLLSQMRGNKLPVEAASPAPAALPSIPGKGHYIDIYV